MVKKIDMYEEVEEGDCVQHFDTKKDVETSLRGEPGYIFVNGVLYRRINL